MKNSKAFLFSVSIFGIFLLSKFSLGAYVNDINPKIYYRNFNCKKLLDEKEEERAKNPDLVSEEGMENVRFAFRE